MDQRKNLMRYVAFAIALVAILALTLVAPVLAADFRGDDVIIIAADEVIDDDLFVAGNIVEVNGTVKGDLFAAGSEVVVNGTVEGSLFIAGQSLEVNGQVDGSVYGGGYSLVVGPATAINRNLYFGGFSLATKAGSTIGRGLYSGGYQFLLDGDVDRDVSVSGGALELDGKVGGDLTAELSEPDASGAPPTMGFPGAVRTVGPGFRQGDNADVSGDLDVKLVTQQFDGAPQPSFAGRILRAIGTRVGEFIALLIVGGLFLWLWPNMVERVSATVQARLIPSAGNGLLTFVAFWLLILAAILAVIIATIAGSLLTFGQLGGRIATLGGGTIYLSIVTFLFVVALVTKMVVAFLVGRTVLDRLSPQTMEGRWGIAIALLVGVLIYELIRAIPLLGWLVGILVTIVGLGAIYLTIRPQKVEPEVVATA